MTVFEEYQEVLKSMSERVSAQRDIRKSIFYNKSDDEKEYRSDLRDLWSKARLLSNLIRVML